MDVQHISTAPINRRGGGQDSYLLLTGGQFGSRNLTITWVDCEPGSEQRRHSHEAQEQVYVILHGRGLIKVEGEEREVEAGALVFIPPGTTHAIRNTGSETLTYVSATSPPFELEELEADQAYALQPEA
jgi:mannose-6-phosphate isomerase-like protein (cupin superfamily)